jgi:hypothetical protein
MAKLTKNIKRIKGIEVKTLGKESITMLFPNIAFPQYFDESKKKFVNIKNEMELKQAKERGEKLSYGGLLLIPKDSPESEKIKGTIDQLWEYYQLDNRKNAKPYPLEDGDEKAQELEEDEKNGDMYKGYWLLKVDSKWDAKKDKIRFQCFNKFGKFFPKNNDEIQGYFVRLGLFIDFYDYAGSVGVKVYLNAIQFMDANPNAQFKTDYENEFDFEEQTEEEKEDAFEKAVGSDEDLKQGIPVGNDGEDDSPFA